MPLLSFPEWKCFKAGWDVAEFARGLTLGSAVRGGAHREQESPPTKLRARPALDNLSPLGEGHPLAHVMDPVGCWQPAGGLWVSSPRDSLGPPSCAGSIPSPAPFPPASPEGVKPHLPRSKAARSSVLSPCPGQWYSGSPSRLGGCQGREADSMGVTVLPPSIWDASLECEPWPFSSLEVQGEAGSPGRTG